MAGAYRQCNLLSFSLLYWTVILGVTFWKVIKVCVDIDVTLLNTRIFSHRDREDTLGGSFFGNFFLPFKPEKGLSDGLGHIPVKTFYSLIWGCFQCLHEHIFSF